MPPLCQVSSRHGGFSGERDGQWAWPHQAYDLEGEDKVVKQDNFELKSDLIESNLCAWPGGFGDSLCEF